MSGKATGSPQHMTSSHRRVVSVIGLGYVGLPIAATFGRASRVIGFDIDEARVVELKRGHDRNGEMEQGFGQDRLEFTSDPARLQDANFHIVAVPTPVNQDRQPDLELLRQASVTIGRQLKAHDIVVYESTVYPGVTEEVLIPILESTSGLQMGVDFGVGYSPERINPGDTAHRFETIVKVVSASDAATLDVVAEVYGSVVKAGIYRAPSIRVAEAAKVIENTQRDLNIALINELAMIFGRLGIDTSDVLAAAETKWNFLKFRPGLVGGHCIGVDPYYLTHKAQRVGFHPQLVLAGRATNDGMGKHVAQETIRLLLRHGVTAHPRVTILGVTYKENVPDVRNSRVPDIVTELERFGTQVQIADPIANGQTVRHETGLTLLPVSDLQPADAVVLAVAHKEFLAGGWKLIAGQLKDGRGPIMDVRAVLDRAAMPNGVVLWRL
jgi:UDP-N-acetyl-D-galactosamine dehydrogenase